MMYDVRVKKAGSKQESVRAKIFADELESLQYSNEMQQEANENGQDMVYFVTELTDEDIQDMWDVAVEYEY